MIVVKIIVFILIILVVSGYVIMKYDGEKTREKCRVQKEQELTGIINSQIFQTLEKEILALGDLRQLQANERTGTVYCHYGDTWERRRTITKQEIPDANDFVEAFFYKHRYEWSFTPASDIESGYAIVKNNISPLGPTKWG